MSQQAFIPTIIKSLLLSIFLVGMIQPNHAQINKWKKKITKKAGEETERKVEEKANEKIGKAIDNLFKKAEEDLKKDKEEKGTAVKSDSSSNGQTVKGGGTNVSIVPGEVDENVEPSEWTGTFTMRMEEYEDDKLMKQYPMKVTYHVDDYKIAMETQQEEGDMIVIFDRQYHKMTSKIIDEEGKKTAFTMAMPAVEVQLEDEEISGGDYSIRKTGRTKKIAGYTCEQYKFDGEEHAGYVWMSEKMKFDFRQMFNWISIKDNKKGKNVSYDEFFPVEGAVMESTSIEKKSNKKSFMTVEYVLEGSLDKGVFSLEGYDHQDMSKMFKGSSSKILEDLMKRQD